MFDNDENPVQGWYPAGRPDAAETEAWYGAGGSSPARTAYEPASGALDRKRRRVKIITMTVCTLVLICAAVTAIWKLIGWIERRAVAVNSVPVLVTDPGADGGDYDDFREYFANYYTGSDGVSIPRAETGTGVTLRLWPETGEDLSLQEIYERVSPAVVGINATRDGLDYSWGTGVVFTPDGYIITNNHIISGCDGATVTFPDESSYEARLVGSDSVSDIAVLKIEGKNFPCAAFGSSDALRVGDEVSAIGNPLGEAFAGTMTNGIISAINRNVQQNGHNMTLLQTNAALNEGNSGGPLVNACGQVVGITNMKIMSSYTSTVEGIGFAIPSAVVKQVADALIELGYVPGTPSIGITAGPVSMEAMARYDLPAGVYVASVNEGSDAMAKGLAVGDIILQVNGEDVRSVADVNTIKDQFAVGDSITLTVYREGETFEMDIVLVDSGSLQ